MDTLHGTSHGTLHGTLHDTSHSSRFMEQLAAFQRMASARPSPSSPSPLCSPQALLGLEPGQLQGVGARLGELVKLSTEWRLSSVQILRLIVEYCEPDDRVLLIVPDSVDPVGGTDPVAKHYTRLQVWSGASGRLLDCVSVPTERGVLSIFNILGAEQFQQNVNDAHSPLFGIVLIQAIDDGRSPGFARVCINTLHEETVSEKTSESTDVTEDELSSTSWPTDGWSGAVDEARGRLGNKLGRIVETRPFARLDDAKMPVNLVFLRDGRILHDCGTSMRVERRIGLGNNFKVDGTLSHNHGYLIAGFSVFNNERNLVSYDIQAIYVWCLTSYTHLSRVALPNLCMPLWSLPGTLEPCTPPIRNREATTLRVHNKYAKKEQKGESKGGLVWEALERFEAVQLPEVQMHCFFVLRHMGGGMFVMSRRKQDGNALFTRVWIGVDAQDHVQLDFFDSILLHDAGYRWASGPSVPEVVPLEHNIYLLDPHSDSASPVLWNVTSNQIAHFPLDSPASDHIPVSGVRLPMPSTQTGLEGTHVVQTCNGTRLIALQYTSEFKVRRCLRQYDMDTSGGQLSTVRPRLSHWTSNSVLGFTGPRRTTYSEWWTEIALGGRKIDE